MISEIHFYVIKLWPLQLENPRTHKNKIGTFPPTPQQKKNKKIPPPKEEFYGHGGFLLQNGAHKIGAAIPAPELRTNILRTRRVTRFFSDGKECYQKANSVKRSGPFSGRQESDNWDLLRSSPSWNSAPLKGQRPLNTTFDMTTLIFSTGSRDIKNWIVLCLEGLIRKPRHASVFSTHSDTQAVPAFHWHFFDTRVF